MACGCKGGSNVQPTTQQTQQTQVQREQTTESVKSAIKKTVEKYYNVNKTTK
jgi:hypothetical protein